MPIGMREPLGWSWNIGAWANPEGHYDAHAPLSRSQNA